MRRYIIRAVFGALLGIGLGVATITVAAIVRVTLPDALQKPFWWVFHLLQWPVFYLTEMDRHRGGRILYENPINVFMLLGLYWVVLGEICYCGALAFRGFRGKQHESKDGSFPVRPS